MKPTPRKRPDQVSITYLWHKQRAGNMGLVDSTDAVRQRVLQHNVKLIK